VFFYCTSIGIAKELPRLLKKVSNSHCAEAMKNKGILVHTISSEIILKPEEAEKDCNAYLQGKYERMENEVFYVWEFETST
jgi:hypothetical protein